MSGDIYCLGQNRNIKRLAAFVGQVSVAGSRSSCLRARSQGSMHLPSPPAQVKGSVSVNAVRGNHMSVLSSTCGRARVPKDTCTSLYPSRLVRIPAKSNSIPGNA